MYLTVRRYLLEMYPSFGSARFDSVLTRAFYKKARLGSARSLSLKTQSMKKGQNESISNYDAKPLCIEIVTALVTLGF